MASPFGTYLRSLRQGVGLTIEELSHASGVSVRAIGDMERGVSRGPQHRTVQALAEALGLDDDQYEELGAAAKAGRLRTVGQAPVRAGWNELPRGLADFVGRKVELNLLREQGRTASADGPPPVVVLHGAGGLGKTACAVRAAELLRDSFPDGRLYVDLRGVDPEPMPPAEALYRLLRASGMDQRAIAEDDQERAGQLRGVLAERRCLVVLDNAADETQVRALLPGRGASMVIMTSRRALGGLEGVTRIPLAPFSQKESAELLLATSGQADDADADAYARVAQLCGHLPLALRIAGTRLASRPGWTMGHLADRLSDEDRRLANLTVGDVGVEAAFALSYVALPERAKECFRRLALVPAVDFGVPVAAVLTGTDLFDAEDQLDDLVELGLLQHEGTDRYRFHDLIRLYAAHRLREEEPAEAHEAAERRMIDWLLETATVAGRWFETDGDASSRDNRLVSLTTPDEAQSWLQTEKDTWLSALRLAAAAGQHEQVAELGEAMRWFAVSNAHWLSDWQEIFTLTHAAAARMSDPLRELWHLNRHVWSFLATHVRRGDTEWREGAERAMEAYRLAENLGAVREQADAACNAAEHWHHLGEHAQSLWAFSRGQELARAAGDRRTYYWATGGMALAFDRLGRLDESAETYRSLLASIEEQPDTSVMSRHSRLIALEGLTITLRHAERWQEAVQVAETGLGEAIEQGSAWTVNMYWTLGRANAGLGATDLARLYMTRAIEMAEEQGAWAPSTFGKVKAILAALDTGSV